MFSIKNTNKKQKIGDRYLEKKEFKDEEKKH